MARAQCPPMPHVPGVPSRAFVSLWHREMQQPGRIFSFQPETSQFQPQTFLFQPQIGVPGSTGGAERGGPSTAVTFSCHNRALGRGVPLGRAEPSPFPSTRAGSCRIYCKPKPQQPPSPAVPEGCVGTEAGEGWITVWKFLYEEQFI